MSVIEHAEPPVEQGSDRTWDCLVAEFTPAQVAAADASVADAPELTAEQIHTLRQLFTGAGERVAASRAEPERGAA